MYNSVEELFKDTAPELVEFLFLKDPIWLSIKENTITDEELKGHSSLLQESGLTPESSAFAKAVQLIQDCRNTCLPSPIKISLGQNY